MSLRPQPPCSSGSLAEEVSEIGSEYNFTEDGRIAFAPLVSMVDVSGTILGSRKGGRLLVHCCLCRIIGY